MLEVIVTEVGPALVVVDVPVVSGVVEGDLEGRVDTLEGQVQEHGILAAPGRQQLLHIRREHVLGRRDRRIEHVVGKRERESPDIFTGAEGQW